ncbi:MAG: glycosyltransferase [Gemmatimonadetes bacterium]|nr:glycosyltransferase [Gemmatimonadota bacterium]
MTQPLTILHAHSGNLYGGVETMLGTLVRYPGPLIHRFALCYEGRLAGELRGIGAQVGILGDVRFSRPWTVLGARRRLAKIIRAHWPAAVMCHSPWALAAFGPVARAQGVPLVLWAHAAFTGRHWLERLARLTAMPDLAICNSQYTRAAFARGFPATRAEVVYPPVAPPPTFDPARRPAKRGGHGASPDTVVIALVARLERGKGHAALLEALASLRDRPGWTAWIVGGAQRRAEDVYRAELERQTNEARIADRVHFLGQRDDVAALLWAGDIYCQPNVQADTFGISFIEALYAGLAVITTDLGGAREIVTPACGVLVPAGDPPALREALERLMADAGLRQRLRAAAPARAAALCAPDAAVQRLTEVLGGVVRR